MKDLTSLLTLPTSLLALLTLIPPTHSQPWPYNLPPHEKYYPEHEEHIKRNLEIQQKLAAASPAGVRKMSNDEGEKFYMEYWQFGDQDVPILESHDKNTNTLRSRVPPIPVGNLSIAAPLLSPFAPHSDNQQPSWLLPRMFGRSLFERDFQCPSGTTSCTSIGQPDSCCQTGETCITVQDTGYGPVGCCPSGETCANEIVGCATTAGYTSCPGTSNGGCCIPGYTCQGVGCVVAGTATSLTTLPVATITSVESSTSISSALTTTTTVSLVSAASVPAPVQTITTTLIVTPSSDPGSTTTVTQVVVITPSTTTASTATTTTTTTSIITKSLTCSSGFQSCPATLGGGCCPTNRACGSVTCPALSTSTSASSTSTTTTKTASAPIRPTSDSTSASSTTTTTTAPDVCPTGFYVCSAYYAGGCCRVGRNCDSTSCPASLSTDIISGSSLTIAAPSGATSASADTSGAAGVVTAGGSCASGWFGCASSAGGGCCPSGFVCGASCSATAAVSGESGSVVGKEAPSVSFGVRGRGLEWVVLGLGVLSGLGMVVL